MDRDFYSLCYCSFWARAFEYDKRLTVDRNHSLNSQSNHLFTSYIRILSDLFKEEQEIIYKISSKQVIDQNVVIALVKIARSNGPPPRLDYFIAKVNDQQELEKLHKMLPIRLQRSIVIFSSRSPLPVTDLINCAKEEHQKILKDWAPYSGVIPFCIHEGVVKIYIGTEKNKKAGFGGGRNLFVDDSSIDTAFRELEEETYGVFVRDQNKKVEEMLKIQLYYESNKKKDNSIDDITEKLTTLSINPNSNSTKDKLTVDAYFYPTNYNSDLADEQYMARMKKDYCDKNPRVYPEKDPNGFQWITMPTDPQELASFANKIFGEKSPYAHILIKNSKNVSAYLKERLKQM